jgi:hypothetical protein
LPDGKVLCLRELAGRFQVVSLDGGLPPPNKSLEIPSELNKDEQDFTT